MKLSDSVTFIEGLSKLMSSAEVGRSFHDHIQSHGFVAAAFGESRETADGRTWDFFFNTWPTEWLSEYFQRDYVRHDIVPTVARISSEPFTWRDALAGRQLNSKQQEHYEWAISLGIKDIFAVPIHYPGGDFGLCVSISDHPIDDGFERAALQTSSLFAHQRCRELGDKHEASSVRSPLTSREVECLRWVLKGKSDIDIGDILGISHTTVHFHIERVKKKLGVRTRTQAAATVMTLGYL